MYGDEYGHMGGFMGWMGFGHGIFGVLWWIIIILVIAALVKYLFSKK